MKSNTKLLSLFISILILTYIGCDTQKKETATPKNTSSKIIVLAIDGGGIKGIIPAIFLQAIEDSLLKQSYQLFDLIGGTSTGGIISVALTTPDKSAGDSLPYSASSIVDVYRNDGSDIFVKQGYGDIYAKYYADKNGKGVEPFIRSMVGDSLKLSDTFKFIRGLNSSRVKQMFTTTYIVNSSGGAITDPEFGKDYGPYLFNWNDANISADDDYYVWEAARGTSAAPTYFPIAHVGGNTAPRSAAAEKWVIDGGIMSNDPAVWGVSEAFRTNMVDHLEDLVVISLGTGVYPGSAGVGITNEGVTVPSDGNWGSVAWVIEYLYDLEGTTNKGGTLVNVILDAVQMVSNNQLDALTASGLTYYRLEPELELSQAGMDNINPQNIDSLIKTAKKYLANEGADTFKDILNTLNYENQ